MINDLESKFLKMGKPIWISEELITHLTVKLQLLGE